MIFYLLPFLLALLPQSSYQIGFVRPLTPFGATFVNTKLPSIYNLHFSLSSGLRSDAYIKVKFANYTTLGTPTCLYGVNLTTGRPTATKACNVVSDSIYLAPGTALESEDQIYLTIFLSQTIPDSPGYTELFEVSTVSSTDSSTAVIFDTNPGFGNFLWGANSNVGTLFMEGLDFGTDATRNLQGASNNVTLHVRFNRGFTAELSRILVVVDMPWKFNSATTEINVARSPLYNVAVANNEPTDLYDTPTINKTQIINDQVIEIYFNGAFPEGREFLMTVTDIVNPIAIASGKLRFYSTDYTSNSVLEANENTVIYTSDNTIDLGISLAAGLPLTVGGPVKLYKNTEQYLKLSFDVGATTIPAGATLKYQFSLDNTPIPGTLFIYKTLTPLTSNSKVAYTYGTDYITLSNLGPLTAGDVIFIQTKMLFSKVQPQLKVTISILFDGVVVKYGESQVFPLNTNAKTAIVSIQGQNAEQNVFDVVGSATIMTFNFYSDTRTTAANSAITIYTNAFISSSGITCNAVSTPAVTAPTCTLTPSSAGVTYTKITITSAANTNVLATGQNVAITLGNLVFAKPSSHEEAIYEFYVRIDKDGTGNAAVQDAMVYAFVRPNRNQLTNLYQYHSLDVSSNTLAQFPSFMRVYGKLNTGSITIAPGANDNVVLTIYGYNTLADFLAVTNEGTFPCGASLSVSCVYIKGNPNKLSTNPIDWDRVIITLDSSATSNDFNFYIPQFFKDATAQPYEFVIGLYDRTTRIYQNTYLENQYSTSPARTPNSFTVTPSGLISNAANLYIDLRGQRAGVTVSSPIALSLETQGGYTFNGAPGGNTGASAVVITEWDLWNSQAVVQSVSTPLSTDDADATVYLRYTTTTGDNQNAVLFPMVGAASPQKLFMIDKVEMPYSLDIPNYVMYITNQMGTLTYWNSLINAGRNALINSSITDFSFNCTHMIQGYLNTYCQVSFTTNAKIDRQAKIRIAYSNAFISIAQCSLTYLTGPSTWSSPVSSSLYSCSSALQQIELSFDMADRLPVTTYQLTFYGFDQGSGSDQSLTFSIYDANYGFVVEQANKNYFLEEAIRDWISIASINYDFLNLDAISNFRLNFTLPRDIYPNEILEFDIGADLQSNNKNTDRLAIVLVNDNTRVEIYGTLKSQILTMQFGQGVQLAAGNYQISILNMKTPTTHSTDKVKIRLRRSTDSVFVMQSQEASFTSYPTLIQGASSFVKIIQSRFLCVACLGEFTFQVSLTNSYIDQNSTIYIHFPSYFLPAITNQAGKLDCRFGFDPVQCGTDPDYPFRLRITGSPFNYNPGSTFNITVYGFIVPNVITVEEAQEDIFFAVDSWYNGTFSEQSNVQLPSMTTIKSNMGAVFFYGLTIARTVVRDKIDHVLRANITANIPVNSTFSVTFTNEYSNLRYLESLPCGINVYINGIKSYGYASANCSIVGQSVKFFITKAISKDYSLELTISSVPTPPKLTTVDPNEFILAAFGVDENDVLAISRETLNSIYYLNFIDAINTIEAQSNNDIILTRGTYSDDIFIGTNGGKRTIQDVSITATAEGFTFAPAVIEFFVGDISHTFKVGCDQNIKLRTYPFNFTQTQDEALVNAYGDMFNVRVTVVDTPVVINIPTEIIVPKGGSSLPIPVQLAQKPFKDMQILIGVDNAYFDGAFGVDLDYSAPSLNFSSTDGLKYLSFYSTDAISSFPSTFTVNLQLDGSNYKSYNLSTYQITIKIQTVAFGTASILATQGLIQKTQAAFSITPAAEGMLVVQLSQDCVARQTLSGIKNILRNNSYANTEITNTGCPQRYLTQVLSTPGVAVTLNLPDLTPETKYNVYMYFENKAKQSNSEAPASFTFTTNSLDATLKMSATFSKTVYLDQLNSVICFLLRLFQTRIVNVVDAGGLSCSSYIEPTNRFLDYPGAYFGNYANTYTFYLLPDPTLEVDTSLTLVPTYFDTTTLLAKTGLYTAAAAEGITFLQEFKMDYYFTYNQAKTSTGSVVMPSLTSYTTDTTTVDGNSTIRLTNFRMTAKGSVYAIAREVAKVIVDPEDEFTTTDVTTRLPRTPTNAQIYACLDWNGDKVDACGRAIIANNDNVELLLRDLKSNTMYIVYYTVANEYPIEPIFGNDIQSFNVRILSSSTIVMAWMVLLGCILSLFM